MSKFFIETDVPVPAARAAAARPKSDARVALDTLIAQGEAGDSIFFDGYNSRRVGVLISAAQRAAGVHKLLFSRTVEGGVRVWRK